VSYPINQLDESSFEEGFGMDGSSIRGWAAIHESDMLLIPDPTTAFMDPFAEVRPWSCTATSRTPSPSSATSATRAGSPRSRVVSQEQRRGGHLVFGAEAEFFIFDNVCFDQNQHEGFYHIDAEEGRWNSSRRENNLGYRPRYKEGYFPVPPPITTRTCAARWCRP